jgi:hypothetical protein
MDQSVLRPAPIFDEAVTVPISKSVNPIQSQLDIGPYRPDQFLVSGSFEIGGC